MPEFNYMHAKKERGDAYKRMKSLHENAEKRDLTAAEQRDFDEAQATCQRLDARMEREDAILRTAQPAGRRDRSTAFKQRPGESEGIADLRMSIAEGLRAVARGEAETRDLTLSTMGTGFAPPEFGSLWDWLAPNAVALKCGITTIDTDRQQLIIPHLTADPAAAWVAENGTITETDPAGATMTITPTKVASLTKLSRELADDSTPSIVDLIMSKLSRAVGLAIDLGVFQGSGASNQPTGLKNTASIQTVSMGTNGASPSNLDQYASAIELLLAANTEATAVVMHPRTWGELLTLKELTSTSNKPLLQAAAGPATAGVENQIFGVPVYLTSQIAVNEVQGTSGAVCSSAYVFNAEQVIMVRSHAMRLEATTDAFFSTDEVGVRCVARVGIAVPNPTSVVRILGIL